MNANLRQRPSQLAGQKVRAKRRISTEILIPAGLIVLSLIPAVGGTVRLAQLATNTGMTPESARFFAQPLPVVAHIIAVILYSLLGALQFAPRFRRRHLRMHRALGRILIPAGFVTAISGLWMSHFYPWPAYDGVVLYIMRLLVGTGMIIALLLGTDAIRRRNFHQHGAWMIRAYALAMGAGTQVFTLMPIVLLGQEFTLTNRAIAMGAGWLINILVAEWIIAARRRGGRRRHKTNQPILASK